MPSKIAQNVQYRCWCESDDCAWTDTGAAPARSDVEAGSSDLKDRGATH